MALATGEKCMYWRKKELILLLTPFDTEGRWEVQSQKMVNQQHTLVLTHPDGIVDCFLMEHDIVTIGRGAKNSIVLDADTVSVWHCEIRRNRGKFELIDLGSTNGTRLNHQALEEDPVEIRNGDKLQIGLDVTALFLPITEVKGGRRSSEVAETENTKANQVAARPSINPVAAAVARAAKENR